jgi:hypothetical protein
MPHRRNNSSMQRRVPFERRTRSSLPLLVAGIVLFIAVTASVVHADTRVHAAPLSVPSSLGEPRSDGSPSLVAATAAATAAEVATPSPPHALAQPDYDEYAKQLRDTVETGGMCKGGPLPFWSVELQKHISRSVQLLLHRLALAVAVAHSLIVI